MSEKLDKIRKTKREFQKKYRKARKTWNVSYTPEEAKKIIENAANAGITPTEFIKSVSLKTRIKPFDPNKKISLELKAEIRRIGVNFNQIAKALNTQYIERDITGFEKELKVFQGQLKHIISKLP